MAAPVCGTWRRMIGLFESWFRWRICFLVVALTRQALWSVSIRPAAASPSLVPNLPLSRPMYRAEFSPDGESVLTSRSDAHPSYGTSPRASRSLAWRALMCRTPSSVQMGGACSLSAGMAALVCGTWRRMIGLFESWFRWRICILVVALTRQALWSVSIRPAAASPSLVPNLPLSRPIEPLCSLPQGISDFL